MAKAKKQLKGFKVFLIIFLFLGLISTSLIVYFCPSVPAIYAFIKQDSLDIPISQLKPVLSNKPQHFPVMQGLSLDFNNPLKIIFYFDLKDKKSLANGDIQRMVRYFLGFITIPEDKIWVNLSPYEGDRIIADSLSQLNIGKDLLLEDYILKQLTSTITDPNTIQGKKFWQEVLKISYRIAGTTRLPIDMFNKVWIVPDQVEIAEYYPDNIDKGPKTMRVAFIKKASLKVMMEEDYLALKENKISQKVQAKKQDKINLVNKEAKRIFKEKLLGLIQEEVSNSVNFAPLRQMYQSLILATYLKIRLRQNIVFSDYIDQEKTRFLNLDNPKIKERVYKSYVESFKQGAYNYIKSEYDPYLKKKISHKYFSGGFTAEGLGGKLGSINSKPLSTMPLTEAAPTIVDFKAQKAISSQPFSWNEDVGVDKDYVNGLILKNEKVFSITGDKLSVVDKLDKKIVFNMSKAVNLVPRIRRAKDSGVVIHTVDLKNLLGIPRVKGESLPSKLAYVLGRKENDGKLHMYVTKAYWQQQLSQNSLALAEAIDHEWAEAMEGKEHSQAAKELWNFTENKQSLSPFLQFMIEQYKQKETDQLRKISRTRHENDPNDLVRQAAAQALFGINLEEKNQLPAMAKPKEAERPKLMDLDLKALEDFAKENQNIGNDIKVEDKNISISVKDWNNGVRPEGYISINQQIGKLKEEFKKMVAKEQFLPEGALVEETLDDNKIMSWLNPQDKADRDKLIQRVNKTGLDNQQAEELAQITQRMYNQLLTGFYQKLLPEIEKVRLERVVSITNFKEIKVNLSQGYYAISLSADKKNIEIKKYNQTGEPVLSGSSTLEESPSKDKRELRYKDIKISDIDKNALQTEGFSIIAYKNQNGQMRIELDSSSYIANENLRKQVEVDRQVWDKAQRSEINGLIKDKKTVVVGDVHGDLDGLREELEASGAIVRSKDNDPFKDVLNSQVRIVQLGDVVDRGKFSIASLLYLRYLQDQAKTFKDKKSEVIRLLGNHEIFYLMMEKEREKIISSDKEGKGEYDPQHIKEYLASNSLSEADIDMFKITGRFQYSVSPAAINQTIFSRPDKWQRLINVLKNDVSDQRMQAAYSTGEMVFSHGVVVNTLIEKLKEEQARNLGIFANREYKNKNLDNKDDFVAVVNKMLQEGVKNNDYVDEAAQKAQEEAVKGIDITKTVIGQGLPFKNIFDRNVGLFNYYAKDFEDNMKIKKKLNLAFNNHVGHDPRAFANNKKIPIDTYADKRLVRGDVGTTSAYGSGRSVMVYETDGNAYEVLVNPESAKKQAVEQTINQKNISTKSENKPQAQKALAEENKLSANNIEMLNTIISSVIKNKPGGITTSGTIYLSSEGEFLLVESGNYKTGKEFKDRYEAAQSPQISFSYNRVGNKQSIKIITMSFVAKDLREKLDNLFITVNNILSINNADDARAMESMGGNAGAGRLAVNMAVNNQGQIVLIGNIQDFSPEERKVYDSSNEISILFDSKNSLIRDIVYDAKLAKKDKAIAELIRRNLEEAKKSYNLIRSKFNLTESERLRQNATTSNFYNSIIIELVIDSFLVAKEGAIALYNIDPNKRPDIIMSDFEKYRNIIIEAREMIMQNKELFKDRRRFESFIANFWKANKNKLSSFQTAYAQKAIGSNRLLFSSEDGRANKEYIDNILSTSPAVSLDYRENINSAIAQIKEKRGYDIDPNSIVLHPLELKDNNARDLLGIPRSDQGEDTSNPSNLVYVFGRKEADGKLHMYVTKAYWQEQLSQNPLALAEAIDHEFNEVIQGKTHREASLGLWDFAQENDPNQLSSFLRFMINQYKEKEPTMLEQLLQEAQNQPGQIHSNDRDSRVKQAIIDTQKKPTLDMGNFFNDFEDLEERPDFKDYYFQGQFPHELEVVRTFQGVEGGGSEVKAIVKGKEVHYFVKKTSKKEIIFAHRIMSLLQKTAFADSKVTSPTALFYSYQENSYLVTPFLAAKADENGRYRQLISTDENNINKFREAKAALAFFSLLSNIEDINPGNLLFRPGDSSFYLIDLAFWRPGPNSVKEFHNYIEELNDNNSMRRRYFKNTIKNVGNAIVKQIYLNLLSKLQIKSIFQKEGLGKLKLLLEENRNILTRVMQYKDYLEREHRDILEEILQTSGIMPSVFNSLQERLLPFIQINEEIILETLKQEGHEQEANELAEFLKQFTAEQNKPEEIVAQEQSLAEPISQVVTSASFREKLAGSLRTMVNKYFSRIHNESIDIAQQPGNQMNRVQALRQVNQAVVKQQTATSPTGGIDLSKDVLNLQIKTQAQDLALTKEQLVKENNLQVFDGFLFEITKVEKMQRLTGADILRLAA